MIGDNETDKLCQWNEVHPQQHIGAIVYFSIMTIVGFLGNVHVACIYTTQFRPSKKRTFFLWMSVVDILACLIAMPFLIIIYTNFLKFACEHIILCKILHYTKYCLKTGPTSLLLVFTIDTCNMICRPHRNQLSSKGAQCACVFTLVVDIFMVCTPFLFFYGHSVDHNLVLDIWTVSCTIVETWENAYNIYISIICGLIYVIIVGFIVINAVIYKRIKDRAKVICSKIPSLTSKLPRKIERDFLNASLRMVFKHRVEKKKRKQKIASTLFILTSITVVSCLPFVSLTIIEIIMPRIFSSLSYTQNVAYNIAYLSPFLIMINPIIYSLRDRTFRSKLTATYRRMFSRFSERMAVK